MVAAASIPSKMQAVAPTTWRADALPLAIMLLVVAATRGIWFGDPVAGFDEQLYSFIGWRMQFGELPFVDWWDRKPFGLFAIFGVAHTLLGPGPLAFQLVASLFALASGWLVYDLARLLVDRFAATMAAAIAIMLLAIYGSYSGQSEVFFTPLMLGMVRLLAERDHPRFAARAALAMLLGGLALQIKYTVIPQCLVLGLYALWVLYRRDPSIAALLARAAGFAVLGLLPTALIAAYYAAIGEFDAFVFANFISFFDRLPAPQGRWSEGHEVVVAPLAVLALGGLYAAFRMSPPRDRHLWALYGLWALASLATVFLPSTVYIYYYAALAGPAALLALPLIDRSGPAKGAIGLLLVMATFSLLSLDDRRATSLEERAAAQRLALAIAPHVDMTQNCLWVFDGPTSLYRMSGSCVPTRFVYPDHLNNALESRALGVTQESEVARILGTRPAAIVTASRAVTVQNAESQRLVQAALAASYEKGASASINNRTLTAWIRRE